MKRYYSIDVLRLLCSFCIVCIHATLYEPIRYWTEPILRVAVPLFFIISGFCYAMKDKPKHIQQTRKIAFISLIALLIYIGLDLGLVAITKGENLQTWITSLMTIQGFAKFIFANKVITPIDCGGHLWFMFALTYTYIFF